MNNELKNKAETILNKLLDALDSGIEKAPGFFGDLLKEYISYYKVSAVYHIIVGTLLKVGSFFSFKAGLYIIDANKLAKYSYEESSMHILFLILGSVLGIIGLLMAISELQTLLMLKYAPKAFLIEKFRYKKEDCK